MHLAFDNLAAQVPTWRANPLTPACDQWCEFPVSDRPNAVRQFFQAAKEDATLIKVLMPACCGLLSSVSGMRTQQRNAARCSTHFRMAA